MRVEETIRPSSLGRGGNLEVEPGLAAPGTQKRGVSAAVTAEAESGAFDHSSGSELLEDDAVKELTGGQAEKPKAGLEDADLGGSGGAHQIEAAIEPGQRDRGGFGSEDRDGGRVEGQS